MIEFLNESYLQGETKAAIGLEAAVIHIGGEERRCWVFDLVLVCAQRKLRSSLTSSRGRKRLSVDVLWD